MVLALNAFLMPSASSPFTTQQDSLCALLGIIWAPKKKAQHLIGHISNTKAHSLHLDLKESPARPMKNINIFAI